MAGEQVTILKIDKYKSEMSNLIYNKMESNLDNQEYGNETKKSYQCGEAAIEAQRVVISCSIIAVKGEVSALNSLNMIHCEQQKSVIALEARSRSCIYIVDNFTLLKSSVLLLFGITSSSYVIWSTAYGQYSTLPGKRPLPLFTETRAHEWRTGSLPEHCW
ncbi:hypothetical protein L210DRAFT_3502059 [Boletus edulis BED1]|uniref:Uncharacterized protein n=1 Tax=Boletus edulis BED1 TaxID=1328754 RepID=A0AAD4C0Q2_BOLED|nr:hypothetical protein L210DRAFT_3502059 [Boletus edulis BED1]